MSEQKAAKPTAAPARVRQTIKLNESTNEAVPRKGAKRRTEPGHDTVPATRTTLTDNVKE